MSFKEIRFGSDGRARLLSGIDKAVRAIAATLGPFGRNVMVDDNGTPHVTKDGVTVAKSLSLPDRFEDMGAKAVVAASSATGDEFGDGTTTSAVIAGSVVRSLVAAIESGCSIRELAEGARHAADAIAEDVSSKAVEADFDILRKVAAVSANGDGGIASIVTEACSKVGDDGTVTIEEGKSSETVVDYTEGMEFSRGYVSPVFAGDDGECRIIDADVLVLGDRLDSVYDLVQILKPLAEQGRRLVVFGTEFSQEAITAFAVNFRNRTLIACPVQGPGIGIDREGSLEDIAIMTGASFISRKSGRSIRDAGIADLGFSPCVAITRGKTSVEGSGKTSQAVSERAAVLRHLIESETSDFDREKLQERLARISGAMAVINVGGRTELEMKELKDRYDDALHAVLAAMNGGVVCGGGWALASAASRLDCGDGDFGVGGKAVVDACKAPFMRICSNAGLNGQYVLEKAIESGGYSVADGEFVPPSDNGVYDPLHVVVGALDNAVSAAVTLVTAECFIAMAKREQDED